MLARPSLVAAIIAASFLASNGKADVVPPKTLAVVDVKTGAGPEAQDGKKLTLHYVGKLESGKVFDTTRARGAPFVFTLGNGTVIPGWEQGLKGMKEGGVRQLTVPPALAYGNHSVGDTIPPNATLLFEIELLKVE